MINPTALVVTPTMSSDKLYDAMNSVLAQTYPCEHLVVFDGPQSRTITPPQSEKIHYMELPWNTGKAFGQSFWGHRIFAAIGHLVNHDIILFLDDDNWFEPNHVETQVNTLNNTHDSRFSYSFRKIYTEDKQFICEDNCESLGFMHPVFNNPQDRLVDTSAYAFRRDFLVGCGNAWHGSYAQDRFFYNKVASRYSHSCTKQYTLAFRLGSTSMSASRQFFEVGNGLMKEKYPEGFPWTK